MRLQPVKFPDVTGHSTRCLISTSGQNNSERNSKFNFNFNSKFKSKFDSKSDSNSNANSSAARKHTLLVLIESRLEETVVQSTLSKTGTFGTGTSCPSQRDVRLIESQIKGAKKGRDQFQVSDLQRCPLRESRLYPYTFLNKLLSENISLRCICDLSEVNNQNSVRCEDKRTLKVSDVIFPNLPLLIFAYCC